jgi:hypothetical protein
MHVMGWECFAGCYVDRHGDEIHAGVIEDHPRERVFSHDEADRRTRLMRAVSRSGPDFRAQASYRLFEFGYRRRCM